MSRVVAVGVAHHITQRGTNRQAVFTGYKSQDVYLGLLKENAERNRLRILGYCLMTNHVHILAIPEHPGALAATFRYAHGRFAQYANAVHCRSGHFWQNRYYSCPVEDAQTGRVLAYIELNPVRAGLVGSAAEFPWSSAAAHIQGREDSLGLLDLRWWKDRWTGTEWAEVLGDSSFDAEALRKATFSGRPLGSSEFVKDLESRLGRRLERQKGRQHKPEGPDSLGPKRLTVAV